MPMGLLEIMQEMAGFTSKISKIDNIVYKNEKIEAQKCRNWINSSVFSLA